MSVVCTIYTTLGGFKAVVWTDVFQALVMFIGLIVILVEGAKKVGGLSIVFQRAKAMNRLKFDNMNPNPLIRLSFWTVIIGRFSQIISNTGTGQVSVQRFCSLPSLRKAQLSTILLTPAYIISYTLVCITGLVVFTYYDKVGCDPLRARTVNGGRAVMRSQNQLLPFFITNEIGINGLSGLFVSVLFSGALSSVSSSLNSISAIVWKDILELKFYYLPERKKTIISKVIVVISGIIAIGMAFLAAQLGGHVLQASTTLSGGMAGPVFGLFILGGFFPCANWYGALFGALFGAVLNLTIAVGQYIERPHSGRLDTNISRCHMYNLTFSPVPQNKDNVFGLFRISFMYVSLVGTLTCVIVGLIVSWITGFHKMSEEDEKYILPCSRRLFSCKPFRKDKLEEKSNENVEMKVKYFKFFFLYNKLLITLFFSFPFNA
ncbi:DgyrCDS5047 [Dimorphilus gyrociliatus]|uniref:DgyrCDS5047 n=1 Tax=Dimorphilus gyrociliatus TaxID=2664684 RepID=A0A7I8VIM4_9ANNE|nr:DgyrCDS5047 [Dimorphilus gyrociliatus]